MNEFELINKFFKPLATSKESFGLTDDVAKISLEPDEELIISKDLLAQDTHFLKEDGGYKIAKKALLSNLSDLASSGSTPFGYMLGFIKNDTLTHKFYEDFTQGLKEVQDEYDLKLLGGDTIRSKTLTFSITIFGKIKKGSALLRKNAKNGDSIYVSGYIGDSYLGLKNKTNKYFHDKHFFPSPRIKLGQELLKNNLSSCAIDISDGLLADLNHICISSNLSEKIQLDDIPFSKEAQTLLYTSKKTSKLDLIAGGEDFELIFSINKDSEEQINQLAKKIKINLTKIGEFYLDKEANTKVDLLDSKNNKIKTNTDGYIH